MTRHARTLPGTLLTLVLVTAPAAAGAVTSAPDSARDAVMRDRAAGAPVLEPLVPEIAAHPYRLEPGPRRFQNRLSFSPGYGRLGSDVLFAFRFAYNPDPWLGYEASIAHAPGQSTHALLHMVSVNVRRPLPGRFQPYLSAGYGMMMVFPGHTLNASPVTKNALAAGGGLECYIRSDLALRADVRSATLFGRQKSRAGVVAYDYLQETIGLSFYRSIRP